MMMMRDDDDLRETLYCFRCSAYSNVCPNFQLVGGHAFSGETYSGGIATGWAAAIDGLDVAGEFNDRCTGCFSCVEACPLESTLRGSTLSSATESTPSKRASSGRHSLNQQEFRSAGIKRGLAMVSRGDPRIGSHYR